LSPLKAQSPGSKSQAQHMWDLDLGIWDLRFFMLQTQELLASLARLVSEESSLDVTLSRVAVLLRDAIPFERLHVLRLDRSDSVTLYVARASGELDVTGHLIGDTPPSPDAADGTERSRLLCTVRQGSRVKGA